MPSGEYEFSNVKAESKRGFWSMLVVMLGFSFFSASMWAGGTLGTSLTSPMFLLSVLLGNALLGCYTGLLAYIASKTGLSTHLLSRYAFGNRGSCLPELLLSLTQVGWFAVGVAMFALPVHKLFPDFPLWVLVAAIGAAMTGTAWFGLRSITVLSVIAVPLIIVMGSTSVGKAFADFGGWQAWWTAQPTNHITFAAAVSVCVASFVSGGTLAPDFTRFSKKPKIAVSTTVIAFFLGNSLMFFFGAVGAVFYQESDISNVLLRQGMIVWAVVVLGLNIWTTNDNAIYSSGLGFSNITKLPKRYFVLINGLIGTVFSLFLYNHFVQWLNWLNVFIPSIGAVLIVDYFMFRHTRSMDISKDKLPNIHWSAIVSWLVGSVAAFLLPGISSLNGMLVSVEMYAFWTIICRRCESSAESAD